MADKIKTPKKLIEVALPLDAINAEAAHEKSIRRGHPSTLHLWWARRPLAAARAVLFAQMVNDPGGERGWRAGLTKQQAAMRREVLFDIIKDLVKWENTNNEDLLKRARREIMASWRETCEMNKGKPGFDPEKLPAFHDPFAGGGAIPLEAQRLGLESYASDLNPVAVMINKAMIEIPPKFADSKPVGPVPKGEDTAQLIRKEYKGVEGLVEDIRRYGYWMHEEAKRRIGHLYPQVEITAGMVRERPDLKPYQGKKLTVIAWLWARTVKSPNPRFRHVDVPLVSSFILSKKRGCEAFVQPVIEDDSYRFEVRVGKLPKEAEKGTKAPGRGADFSCILSNTPISGRYIKDEGIAGRMGTRLMAIVCEGNRERVFLAPNAQHEEAAQSSPMSWRPTGQVPAKMTGGTCVPYGLDEWWKLFTPRQLVALNTFSVLVQETREKVIADAKAAGMTDDGMGLDVGGIGATAYGDAIATYLSFAISKTANRSSSICTFKASVGCPGDTFTRQAIPMSWDFSESNVLNGPSGSFESMFLNVCAGLSSNGTEEGGVGHSLQADAQTQSISANKIVSTDPPYYDNIGYADLSDYFYLWLRRSLRSIYPDLFSTIAVPKAEELVATAHRHGSKEKAEAFFLSGMTDAMHHLAEQAHPAFPVTIYYAFKSSDTDDAGTGNTGWETFLEAVLHAGFAITGTWPMNTERANRFIAHDTNALASSIVLVCRKRDTDAEVISRGEFLSELNQAMPDALSAMMGKQGWSSPIAPVDLAQAAIGPGMEIFSKYKAVLKANGTPMSVHEAMIEINREITDYLNPEMSGFDAATLFCNDWFQLCGWNAGPFGKADTLARAKGTSVDRIRDAGVITAVSGKVQLLNWQEYPADYDPSTDNNLPTWEACHHLIRVLNQDGEHAAGELLSKMPNEAENIRQLAYYLYTLCERKGNAEDARFYNELMTSWHAILAASNEARHETSEEQDLF